MVINLNQKEHFLTDIRFDDFPFFSFGAGNLLAITFLSTLIIFPNIITITTELIVIPIQTFVWKGTMKTFRPPNPVGEIMS